MLGAAKAGRHEHDLLLHQRIVVGERLRGGQDQRVRRRAERKFVAVNLEPGGAAAARPKSPNTSPSTPSKIQDTER